MRWQFGRRNRQNKDPDWLMALDEPFFRDEAEAEIYVMRELPRSVPAGWKVNKSSGFLTWGITKTDVRPGEWRHQDYCLRISKGLDFVILTYGNKDIGPLLLSHVLLNALVIESVTLRQFGLSECLTCLFTHQPNEWGYT
jgi:hypothetical protein